MLRHAAVGAALVVLALGVLVSPAVAEPTTPTAPPPSDDDGSDRGNRGSAGVDPNGVWGDVTVTTPGGPGTTPISTGSSYFDGCIFDRAQANVPYVTGRSDIASVNVDNSVFPDETHVIFALTRLGRDRSGSTPTRSTPPEKPRRHRLSMR